MNLKIVITDELTQAGYYVTVETKSGNRYATYYYTKPSIEDVRADFEENKSSFRHIN